MARLSIADLQWPDDEWRVDLHSRGFETVAFAANEDAKRARKLRKQAKRRKGKRQRRLLALADQLDPSVTPDTPATLASARFMRDLRIRIIGHIWQAVAQDQTGKVARFDVIKPAWACDRRSLKRKKPASLKAEFRADLLRAATKVISGGAASCRGFLCAMLHGEFESEEELFQLHWHVVATGDWVAVLDRLKKTKAYKRTTRVNRPVRARRNLYDLAYALTYLLKLYWPGKWAGKVSGQSRKRRRRKHGRIPEPYHSDALLWLQRWQVSDLALLIRIRAGKEGLVVNSVHQ